jgi:hypothetical protein
LKSKVIVYIKERKKIRPTWRACRRHYIINNSCNTNSARYANLHGDINNRSVLSMQPEKRTAAKTSNTAKSFLLRFQIAYVRMIRRPI